MCVCMFLWCHKEIRKKQLNYFTVTISEIIPLHVVNNDKQEETEDEEASCAEMKIINYLK